MPYEIINNCVHKKGEQKPLKCYDNKKAALAYLRALEANVPDAKELAQSKVYQGLLSQAETNYVALSPQLPTKACANCRWFDVFKDGQPACYIVAQYPEPILATGYCDRWEATPVPQENPQEPIPVTIVEPPMDTDDSSEMEMALPMTKRCFMDLVRDVLKSLSQPQEESAFSVFKMNGKKYWISRHTGKWKDREDEILANHAHDEYVTRVQSGQVPMPELWTWHKKGSRHGQADMVWRSGGFTLALGHFDDTPIAERAFQFYQKQRGKIKLSHMFHYPKRAKQGRVFHAYNTVEITTLPDGAEAFPYTSFEEIDPMLTDAQRAFIKDLGGDDMLKLVESADVKAQKDTEHLDALGIESKGLANFEGSQIPPDESVQALESKTADLETRLKAVEGLSELFNAVKTAMKAQETRLNELQSGYTAALEKANTLEKRLLEYEAVAPPSSKSGDTLLNEREKSVIEQAMAQAKSENTPSLIDMAMGRPVATSQ